MSLARVSGTNVSQPNTQIVYNPVARTMKASIQNHPA